ncbi:LamG domain-containing protein [Agarilytica rhodophyticola]|uniref:LamG domain-containing protein n=1 Tax=Agarilytica rhodophyticola TaxID=1737490 RepID=UPI000B344081|nr:LamG domain-containing protein [Agarilytica rhodophyticola]
MRLTAIKRFSSLISAVTFATLVGCGGGDSGQQNEAGTPPPPTSEDTGLVYNGPAAATDDVLQFRINLWNNVAGDDRCGACHNEVVGQEPLFMRRDDINLAYEATLPLVDKATPVLSRLVERAAEGHNAWSPAAADILQNFIQSWATATGASSNAIVLTAPEEREVGATRRLPTDSAAFNTYIYQPILANTATGNCIECHSEDSATRQQPFFASRNIDTAYFAARTLIDVNNPASSRFVRRMQEGHNSWADPSGTLLPAAYSAQEMLAAINNFVNNGVADPEPINPDFLVSRAINIIENGVIASSGGRFDTDTIALYEFKQGAGSVAFDTSGVDPALDLNLTPSVDWVGSFGIRIKDNGKATGTTIASKKLNDLIRLTGEYSVEAWVVPGNVTQEESRIITYSGGTNARNFSLNQNLYDYRFLTRSENSDENGMPSLDTPSADEVLQATLQHVVATYDPVEGRRIYVNGELISQDTSDEFAGNINDWDDSFVLVLGNEPDNARPWEGTVRLLAIHNRVLTEEQITANFDAGVGQKYFLLFGVSHLVDMPQAYVVFSVEVFDDYSYLFSSPFFISLDRDAVPSGDINIQGMRIGINGSEADIGQAFANIDVTVNAGNYSSEVGVPLSTTPTGTLIGLEEGQLNDLFFLTFEQIGSNTYNRPADPTPAAAAPVAAETQPDFGLRLFDEIFQNLSAITTVPSSRVYDFYTSEVRRSLPGAVAPNAFLSSQQSAITQLSLAYCSELINDNALRSSYFGNYGDLSTPAMMDALIDPLLDRMLIVGGGTFATQPDADDIKDKLVNAAPEHQGLLPKLQTNNQNTKAIAVCTSVLASAAMLMQ